jgi:hypothetical protein
VIAGGGFYSYYYLQCILHEEKKNIRKIKVLSIQKIFNAFFRNWFNPVLGQFHAYPNLYVVERTPLVLLPPWDALVYPSNLLITGLDYQDCKF